MPSVDGIETRCRIRAAEAGIDGVLHKPVSVSRLLTQLPEIVAVSRVDKTGSHRAMEPQATKDSVGTGSGAAGVGLECLAALVPKVGATLARGAAGGDGGICGAACLPPLGQACQDH